MHGWFWSVHGIYHICYCSSTNEFTPLLFMYSWPKLTVVCQVKCACPTLQAAIGYHLFMAKNKAPFNDFMRDAGLKHCHLCALTGLFKTANINNQTFGSFLSQLLQIDTSKYDIMESEWTSVTAEWKTSVRSSRNNKTALLTAWEQCIIDFYCSWGKARADRKLDCPYF